MHDDAPVHDGDDFSDDDEPRWAPFEDEPPTTSPGGRSAPRSGARAAP
jgi:hypothetical protein